MSSALSIFKPKTRTPEKKNSTHMSPTGPPTRPRSGAVGLRLTVIRCSLDTRRAASAKPTTPLHSPCTSKQASRCTPTEARPSTPWCQRYSGRRRTLAEAKKRTKTPASVKWRMWNTIASRRMSQWSGCKSTVVSVAKLRRLSRIMITMAPIMVVISAAMPRVVRRKNIESESATTMVWLSSALKSSSCVTTSSSTVTTKCRRITATVVKSSRSSTLRLLLRTPKAATSPVQTTWSTQISFLSSLKISTRST